MIYRPFLLCILLALSAPAHAQEFEKLSCPTKQLNAAVAAIANAPLCQRAMALYEACGSDATNFDSLVAMADAARSRCEKVFMDGVGERDKRAYRYQRIKCDKQIMAGPPLFQFPKALCGPYRAYDYAKIFSIEKEKRLNNSDPPL